MKTHRLILPALLLILTHQLVHAGSATWGASPISGDWNTAANWMPNTVPNGPGDVATFGASDVTDLSISNIAVEVSNLVFKSGAPPFTITVNPSTNLNITGSGIVNNSGVIQSLVQIPNGLLSFTNATAGDMTAYSGNFLVFNGTASAGSASFAINSVDGFQGDISFNDNTTAAEANITVSNLAFAIFGDSSTAANAVITATSGGFVIFGINSTADHAIVTCSGGGIMGGSSIAFTTSGTAGQGQFTANGATASSEPGTYVDLSQTATAADGTFLINGGTAQDAAGAVMTFLESSTAGNATITANGGLNGGEGGAILFLDGSRGGTASISLFGNGELDIGNSNTGLGVMIGSLAGDGLVFLGPKTLTIGSNNQSTTFSGVIQDGGDNQGTGGSLTKLGTGTLTLSGANTYTGTTTVSTGTLVVNNTTGSATGTGAVSVNAGTLGGQGIVSGALTVGTGSGAGAFLAPAAGSNKQATLTIQSALTFNADATYTYTFKAKKKKARTDKVIANGVTINSGATFAFQGTAQGTLKQGLVLTVISNTAATPIVGTFVNLPDGSILAVNGNNFQASYEGGDGNDLTLTVVP